MNKVFEALKTIKIKCHPNSNPSPIVDEALEIVEQAITELKAIKEANSSEALEKLDKVNNYLNDVYDYKEIKEEVRKDIDTIKQSLLKAQEQEKENCEGGRLANKEILYLKQSIEQCNDKPIFYFSKRYGNKYIVPQGEYEKLNKENAEYKKVLEIIKEKNVLIYNLKIADNLAEYNRWVDDENALTQKEFDLLKR